MNGTNAEMPLAFHVALKTFLSTNIKGAFELNDGVSLFVCVISMNRMGCESHVCLCMWMSLLNSKVLSALKITFSEFIHSFIRYYHRFSVMEIVNVDYFFHFLQIAFVKKKPLRPHIQHHPIYLMYANSNCSQINNAVCH